MARKTPEVIQDLNVELKGKTAQQVWKLLDGYFQKQIWSIEKEQWNRMNRYERKVFVRVVVERFTK